MGRIGRQEAEARKGIRNVRSSCTESCASGALLISTNGTVITGLVQLPLPSDRPRSKKRGVNALPRYVHVRVQYRIVDKSVTCTLYAQRFGLPSYVAPQDKEVRHVLLSST